MKRQRRQHFSASVKNQVRRVIAATMSMALACLACGLAGCASTSQARKAETSGFLRDYSTLRPGAEGEAQLLYVNPSAQFGTYKKILMDPIVVQAVSPDSALSEVPNDELQSIVNYLDATVREHLQGDYTFVTAPGPDTLRLRIAITEAKGANVALSAASMVVPGGSAINVLQKTVTGASTGVAGASCEMELLDSQNGERLAAAVDSRVGGKMSSLSKWQGVKDAYDYWAERLRVRLAELRAK